MAIAALTRMVCVDAMVGLPPQNTAMSSVSRPGVSRHSCAAISPVVYICAMPGDEQQPGIGELRAPLLLERDQPVLLTRGVGVVTLGGEAGLHHLAAELGEGAHGVQHHRGAVEQFGQRARRCARTSTTS